MPTHKGYNRKISDRIKALSSFCEKGLVTFDLCCDHGLIGFNAHQDNDFKKVVFVDQIKSITDALKKRISLHASNQPFEVLCLPAEKISLPDEPVNVIIAGVYAATIFDVIKSVPLSREGDTYIFSPNSDHGIFEKKIENHGLKVIDKVIVEENKRTYPIYKCQK